MGPARLALIALLALYSVASAARTQQEQQLAIRAETAGGEESVNQLNTYYFDASKPQVALSSRGSARAGRTGVTVTLPGSSSVSTFMPVVSPKADGMTHSVSRTWSALKNLATMFDKANTINRQNNPSAPRLFPRAVVAVTAASDNAPVHMDVAKAITVAEASGRRSNWAEVTPSSVLLLPFGQSTGAVADVMGVTYDPKADAVTLELDIVHDPHTISEFQPHAKQTLQVDEAHYHFDTAPGVKVDAQALLDNLRASHFALEGAHLFIKGKGDAPACFTSTLTADKETASVGENVTVTLTITGLACGCDSDACSEQECCFATHRDDRGTCCGQPFDCLVCEGTCTSSPCDDDQGQLSTCCPVFFQEDSGTCCDSTTDCNNCLPSKLQNRTGNHWPHTAVGAHWPHRTAGALAAQPAAVGAGNHAQGAAPTKAKQTPNPGAPKSPGFNKRVGDFSDIYVELTLVGDAEWNREPTGAGAKASAAKKDPAKAPTSKKLTAKVPRGTEARQLPNNRVPGSTDADDSFEASLTVTGPGPIFVLLTYIEYGPPAEPSVAAINSGGGVSVPVDKLALLPKKAHRHLHDPIELTAIAQDASNSPVVGASVAFKVYGDCDPTADVSSATTGAGGVAHVTVVCSRPGEAWVVAAGVDAAGAPVLSEPAFIFFKPGGYDYYPGEGHEGYYHDNGYGYDRGYDRDDRYHHPY